MTCSPRIPFGTPPQAIRPVSIASSDANKPTTLSGASGYQGSQPSQVSTNLPLMSRNSSSDSGNKTPRATTAAAQLSRATLPTFYDFEKNQKRNLATFSYRENCSTGTISPITYTPTTTVSEPESVAPVVFEVPDEHKIDDPDKIERLSQIEKNIQSSIKKIGSLVMGVLAAEYSCKKNQKKCIDYLDQGINLAGHLKEACNFAFPFDFKYLQAHDLASDYQKIAQKLQNMSNGIVVVIDSYSFEKNTHNIKEIFDTVVAETKDQSINEKFKKCQIVIEDALTTFAQRCPDYWKLQSDTVTTDTSSANSVIFTPSSSRTISGGQTPQTSF